MYIDNDREDFEAKWGKADGLIWLNFRVGQLIRITNDACDICRCLVRNQELN